MRTALLGCLLLGLSAPLAGAQVVSDTTTLVNGHFAAYAETPVNPGWTAQIPGARWIWSTPLVIDPTHDDTEVFTKTFTAPAGVTLALDLASDNGARVVLNGHVLVDSLISTSNFWGAVTHYTIPSNFAVVGTNTLVITVINLATPDTPDPHANPAGLLYRVTMSLPTSSGYCTGLAVGQPCVSVANLKITGAGVYADHIDIKPATAKSLSFTATDSLGRAIKNHVVRWWTTDSVYATVSSGGRLTGLAYGKTSLWLQVGAQSTSLPILITPFQFATCSGIPAGSTCVAVSNLQISGPRILGDTPDHVDIVTATSLNLGFIATDSAGTAISRHSVGWWTSTPAIDTVYGGRLTGRAMGEGLAWLRVGLTLATLPVCTSPVPTYFLTLSYDSAKITVGDTAQLTTPAFNTDTVLIGVNWVGVTGGSYFILNARDANGTLKQPMSTPCVHWKNSDPTHLLMGYIDKNRVKITVLGADSSRVFLPGLSVTATRGTKIP